MSTAPAAPTGAGGGGGGGGADAPQTKPRQMSNNCWSCRVIPGGGLILSAAYVFSAGWKAMRQGGPPSISTIAQVAFAAGLAALGLTVIVDPDKGPRKT